MRMCIPSNDNTAGGVRCNKRARGSYIWMSSLNLGHAYHEGEDKSVE